MSQPVHNQRHTTSILHGKQQLAYNFFFYFFCEKNIRIPCKLLSFSSYNMQTSVSRLTPLKKKKSPHVMITLNLVMQKSGCIPWTWLIKGSLWAAIKNSVFFFMCSFIFSFTIYYWSSSQSTKLSDSCLCFVRLLTIRSTLKNSHHMTDQRSIWSSILSGDISKEH